SRHQAAPTRDSRGSRVGRCKSRAHIEISRERRDRSGPALSDVRDHESSGCAGNSTAADAAAAAATQETAAISSGSAAKSVAAGVGRGKYFPRIEAAADSSGYRKMREAIPLLS